MNTNDIQELLEGTLSDEQMAEALHVLSVSPERRTAFRQHMALRDALEKDRLTNGLRSDEDAAIWGAIAGGSGVVANPVARPFLGGWMRRGIALATAGVVGYILGSTQFGAWFGGGEQAGNQQEGGSVEAVSNIATAPLALAPSALIPSASAALQQMGDRVPAASDLSATVLNSTVSNSAAASKPQIIYRDRIVRVPVESSSNASSSASLSSASDPVKNAAVASAVASAEQQNSQPPTASNTPPTTPTSSLANDLHSMLLGNQSRLPLNSGMSNGMSNGMGNGVSTEHAASNAADNTDKANNNSGKGNTSVAAAPRIDPTRANGFEMIYSERLGMLAPTPQGITNPDREFSNRSVGAMYRFGEGQFGLGTRMVYGTLASVSLQKVGVNITGGNDYGPVLNASKKLWVEAVGNYRIPLSGTMALNFEGSFGTNSTSTLYGADAFVVWYFTNTIGAQLGAGVASYSYDLREERRKLIEGSLNDGVVSTASDTYRGTLLQGRYGIFFQF